MLYLEDYLELIEHLPQELRERFTEMRELDLSVQNIMDSLEKRIKCLFGQCKRGEVTQIQADIEYANIRSEYQKALEDADEKIHLATQIYDLVDRYLRRLDTELYKFKCELEADHTGITEILEKRSLELDGVSNPASMSQKENRYFGMISNSSHSLSNREHKYRVKSEKHRDSFSGPPEKRPALGVGNIPTINTASVNSSTSNFSNHSSSGSTTPSVVHSLQYIGAEKAIATAASQAIAATQQMQQGRRTASLKASYEATLSNSGSGSHELLLGRNLVGVSQNTLQIPDQINLNPRRHKKKMKPSVSQNTSSGGVSPSPMTSGQVLDSLPPPVALSEIHSSLNISESSFAADSAPEPEWNYDPNEPRYCMCNQVSYGDMVACDNESCPYEWFHYPCVGITQSPKGKWYCPKCTALMKRRGSRKN